jgi:predicted dehydrogenase
MASEYGDLTAMVVGLGSMGKRRVRNLRALGAGRIVGWDTREDRRQEAVERYGIDLATGFEEGLAARPDVLLISTPPHRHIEPALAAIAARTPFFMEANCFLRGLPDIVAALQGHNLVAAPSRTLWFEPGACKVKQIIEDGLLGTPAEFAHHCGHTLLLWHPWEDYREFYGGQIEAKGAGWDMVGFEMYVLTYFFGKVRKVSALYGKKTDFDTPVDDTFQLLLEFEAGTIGSAMIDVVAPTAYRTTRIISQHGVIEWSNNAHTVDLLLAGEEKWTRFSQAQGHVEPGYVAAEEMYVAEVNAFLQAARGHAPYVATFTDEVELMKVVEAVKVSRDSGRHVSLS